MYIVDDKNLNFYDRIFYVLDGRGVSSLPVSEFKMDEKSKPSDTYIANVGQSFDCKKNQDFLTFIKKNKFKKAKQPDRRLKKLQNCKLASIQCNQKKIRKQNNGKALCRLFHLLSKSFQLEHKVPSYCCDAAD